MMKRSGMGGESSGWRMDSPAGLGTVVHELTRRTRVVIAGVSAILLSAWSLSSFPAVEASSAWENVIMTVTSTSLAVLAVGLAVRLPVTAKARTQSFMLAAGMAAFALGDFVWMYHEVYRGVEPPFPGLPDLFYGPAMYVPLILALWSALLSMRRLSHVWVPLVFATTVSAVIVAILWLTTLRYIVDDLAGDPLALTVSLAYPLADVVLLLVPTIALIVVLGGFGGAPLARPWWSIATAMIVLAATDSLYSYLQAHGAYTRGSVVDMGWLIAFAMMVVGISRMLDLYTAEV